MQRQTDFPYQQQHRGQRQANQHARHDCKAETGIQAAPLNRQRRGGPDQDDGNVGNRNGDGKTRSKFIQGDPMDQLLAKTGRQNGANLGAAKD